MDVVLVFTICGFWDLCFVLDVLRLFCEFGVVWWWGWLPVLGCFDLMWFAII